MKGFGKSLQLIWMHPNGCDKMDEKIIEKMALTLNALVHAVDRLEERINKLEGIINDRM